MTAKNSFSALRQRAGLSVEELAKETGFSARTVYRWESGEMEPRAAVIRALEVLGAYPPRPANSQSAFRFIDLFADVSKKNVFGPALRLARRMQCIQPLSGATTH